MVGCPLYLLCVVSHSQFMLLFLNSLILLSTEGRVVLLLHGVAKVVLHP
ncbi:hypothetical protein SLEP1_g33885 [Rubroshorea leprosula]|uniref:NADH dehydrogenase subunit 4L n=1 Tax=Rubroshorea leprosula TaxID=152421 RepID=A0AAV5KI58_9ROSI|nr:hypothetical protein SLEP1_g33885 [Rubroshorea leprosula]